MKKFITLLLLLSPLTACSREPRTALTRRMEKAGAGELQSVTTQSIEQWFRQHPDVAIEISRTCSSMREKAPAKWGDSTDGRICAAAAKVHFFYYQLRSVNGITFSISR